MNFLMSLLFSNQYNNMLDIIKNLMEENERLKADNARLSRDLTDLQTENNTLKEALRSKTMFVDFPATKKLHEDKIY